MSDMNALAAETPTPRPAAPSGKSRSLAADAWHDLRRSKIFWAALVIIGIVLLMAIWPSLFTSADPRQCILGRAHRGASGSAIFGYDYQGCDVYARTVYGARNSIVVGVFATLIAQPLRALGPQAPQAKFFLIEGCDVGGSTWNTFGTPAAKVTFSLTGAGGGGGVGFAGAGVLGSAIGGLLVGEYGAGVVLVLDAASFFAIAFVLLRARVEAPAPAELVMPSTSNAACSISSAASRSSSVETSVESNRSRSG